MQVLQYVQDFRNYYGPPIEWRMIGHLSVSNSCMKGWLDTDQFLGTSLEDASYGVPHGESVHLPSTISYVNSLDSSGDEGRSIDITGIPR